MKLTRDNLDSLFVAINANLNRGLGTAWTEWEKFAMTINSSTAIERYPMLMLTGAMREWVGDRVVNELSGQTIDVTNLDYEHTESISRNDIEDDVFGLFAPMFEAIGIEAGNLWGRILTEAMTTPGKWADGAAFYGSRKLGKATIDNLVSGALTATNYEAARARMMAFSGPDGKTPLGLVPNVMIVGTTLEATAKRIFKTDLVVSGNGTESNIHKDEVEIILNPFLTGNDWYLACTNRGVRPFAVQKRKVGALVRWDKDSDSCVKDKNRYDYGLHYRGAAAAVAPHLVIKGAAS